MNYNEWIIDVVSNDLQLSEYELMQLEDILYNEPVEDNEPETLPEWIKETI